MGEKRKVVTVLRCDLEASRENRSVDEELRRRVLGRSMPQLETLLEAKDAEVSSLPEGALLAVFGLDRSREDDGMRAVLAASELLETLEGLSEELSDIGVTVEGRCSVNTGEVLVGEDGYLGGAAIEAAVRLADIAVAGRVLIGAETNRLVGNAVEVEPGGRDPIPHFFLREARASASTSVVRLDAPMVGRDRELNQLTKVLELTTAGEAHLVSIIGEAGVGKSRLMREFLALGGRDATILGTRCPPYGRSALYAMAALFERAAGADAADDKHALTKKLESLVSEHPDAELIAQRLADLVRHDDETPPLPETFWAIRRSFETLAETRPLIVALEDLHWAEPTLLDLLEQIVGWLSSTRVMLVATARPVFLEERSEWGKTVPRSTSLTLDPIDPTASELLVQHLLGDAPDDLADRVVTASGGSPLFIEQLLTMMIEMGLLARTNGSWRVDAQASAFKLPATMTALLAARLDRLSPQERDIATRAAIPAGRFTSRAIEAMASDDAVDENLRSLVGRGLLTPAPSDIVGEDSFEFAHALLRDTAYESLTKEMRSVLHERHASWLEEQSGEAGQEENLGYHYERAYLLRKELGPTDERAESLRLRAAALLEKAGEMAFAQEDYGSASKALMRTLFLLGDEEVTSPTALMAIDALRESGDVENATRLIDALRAQATEEGDDLWTARIDLWDRHLQFFTKQGWDQLTWESLSPLLPIFERADDRPSLAKLHLLAGLNFLGQLSQPSTSRAHLEKALDYASDAGPRAQANAIRGYLPALTWFSDLPAREGLTHLSTMKEQSRGNHLLTARILLYEGLLSACLGDVALGEQMVDTAFRAFEDVAPFRNKGFTWVWHELAWMGGDYARAETELRNAIDELGDSDVARELSLVLGALLLEQNKVKEVTEILARVELAEREDFDWLFLQAELARVQGDDAGALATAEEMVGNERRGENLIALSRALLSLAEVQLVRGDTDAAREAAKEAEVLFARKEVVSGVERARALLDRLG